VDSHAPEGVTLPILQSNIGTAQPKPVTVPTSHLSGTGNPVASLEDRQTEMSRTVDRVVEDTNTVKAWRAAVNNINSVMKTINPIVKVCAISFFLYDSLSHFLSLSWMLAQH
jgi:hypothetical protein